MGDVACFTSLRLQAKSKSGDVGTLSLNAQHRILGGDVGNFVNLEAMLKSVGAIDKGT